MLGKLFGKKSGTADEGHAPALPPGVAQTILNSIGIKTIPAMPNSAQQAFQLATDPNADAHDFIEVIEADEALSARVMKIANSVFYDRGHGSKTIPDAIAVIGLSELKGLFNASALTDLFPSKHRLREQLWANDVASAIIAKHFAQRFKPSLVEQAFLGGLMHDMGKLLLLQRNPEVYERIVKHVQRSVIPFEQAEAEEYPFDHTEVGLLIAEKWNFTPELKACIREHHRSWADLPSFSLPALVKAADTLAHALGLGHGPELRPLKTLYSGELPAMWEALKIPAGEHAAILDNAKRSFDEEYELYASWCGGS